MGKTMKAFIVTGPQTAGVQVIQRWAPETGEILVRTRAVGICTLDRRLFKGPLPHYPVIGGHEVAGEVEWADERQCAFKPGDRVAVDVMNRCGRCYFCLKGSNNICLDMTKPRKSSEFLTAAGGFAEYVLVPYHQAVKLPEDFNLEEASLTEPLACCLHSIKRAHLSPGETAAILGAGTMGTLHVLLARLGGAHTIVSDPDEDRLRFVQGQGAVLTVNPQTHDPVQFVKDHTNGRGADAVFVTASSMKAGEQALDMVARTGRVILYASLHPATSLQLDWNAVHYQEITVTGSANNTDRDFQEAANLLGNRVLNLQPLVSRIIPLDELADELMCRPTGNTQRVILSM